MLPPGSQTTGLLTSTVSETNSLVDRTRSLQSAPGGRSVESLLKFQFRAGVREIYAILETLFDFWIGFFWLY